MFRFKLRFSEKTKWYLRALLVFQTLVLLWFLGKQHTGKRTDYYEEVSYSLYNSYQTINGKTEDLVQMLNGKVRKYKKGNNYFVAIQNIRSSAWELHESIRTTIKEMEFSELEYRECDQSFYKKMIPFSNRYFLVQNRAKKLEDAFEDLDMKFQSILRETFSLPKNTYYEYLALSLKEDQKFCGVNKSNWVNCLFDGLSFEATKALLQKLQTDIALSEYELVDMLAEHIVHETKEEMIYEPTVIPNANVLEVGETFEANIFCPKDTKILKPIRQLLMI